MSMALLVYEGTRGPAAAEIYNSLHLPWHRDIVRIGFRDLHRYLRSYFSSEGFLKGLVLSKPNATIRDSYIETLKFYGFQSDTSITEPVFTTQASVGNREGASNETTSPPPTTTQVQITTLSTMKPGETETTIPTTTPPKPTMETTTNIITATNEAPTQPDILSMQGPEDKTTEPPTTTILTTIISETTKKETATTEAVEAQETTLVTTKEMSGKTTITEEELATTEIQTVPNEMMETGTTSQETTTTQESKTESSTADMDVITMTNPTPSELKSMNMMLSGMNRTEGTETNVSEGDSGDLATPETETEMNEGKTTISNVIPVIKKEITTKEIFTDGTETVTLFVDTTIPIEEVTLLTTPLDVEVFTDKDSLMSEALIFMEQNSIAPHSGPATDSAVSKRSTEFKPESLQEYSTPPNSRYSVHTNNKIESNGQNGTDNQSWNINNDKDQILVNSLVNTLINNVNISYTNSDRTTESSNFSQNGVDGDLDEATGFPTLEPDTIIFPTITAERIRRAVKYDEQLQPAGLGNWVGSSGWRPSPTEQWFWTFTGDKLVPVLTYTAFLPYADLPGLRATAIQLPLDDVRYTLTILLPKNARGLKQLLQTLQWCPLRSILKRFKPTPVYAVVPTFTIVKHINLTPALHKLGVRKIFNGYEANLCEMSDEPNLYIRSVEQVITISVQKYFTNQNLLEASPSQVEQHFLATHPFVYLVVDVETKVALVAGTLVDPAERSS